MIKEEFIIKATRLISDEKATAIIEYITYNITDDKNGIDVFTTTIKVRLGMNAMKAKKILFMIHSIRTQLLIN